MVVSLQPLSATAKALSVTALALGRLPNSRSLADTTGARPASGKRR